MTNVYYDQFVENAVRKESTIDDKLAWINCPVDNEAKFNDVAVDLETGDIFGTCVTCGLELRLTP